MEDVLYRLGTILAENADTAMKWAFASLAAGLGGVITWFGKKRVRQEEEKHRETHTLNLFEALSKPNPHLQLAAASVLAERLRRLAETKKKDVMDVSEKASIEHALHSMLKAHNDLRDGPAAGSSDTYVSPELTKFIAEQLVILNDALPIVAGRPPDIDSPEGRRLYSRPAKHKVSPLKRFDWQKVRIVEAWLPGTDARGVDFFKAELIECGMRYAHLNKAVFYEAVLQGTKLGGANLTGANLYGADLAGVDLREAKLAGADLSQARNWETARWQGASYSPETKFPDGFAPQDHEMVLVHEKST